jgi:DNA-binding MarR family transcriptional regulator
MSSDAEELRLALRAVLRGLHGRHRLSPELLDLLAGEPPLGRRHVALLDAVAGQGGRSVGELAGELGLTLPAASKLARDLEEHGLVSRREDEADRRRTVLELDDARRPLVEAWVDARDRPFRKALESLEAGERDALVRGLRALADALLEESACGPVRSHHRRAPGRGSHRHRPV